LNREKLENCPFSFNHFTLPMLSAPQIRRANFCILEPNNSFEILFPIIFQTTASKNLASQM